MKEYIQNSIDNFINTNHYNRALFINGEWGSGKTHFIKNELKTYLKSKGYDLIYITLNGIESLIALKKTIILEAVGNINPDAKKNVFTRALEKAKKYIGYMDKADAFFAIFDLKEFVKIDKTIFCFDDLERISKELKIDDVLGLINTQLIEHNNCKVILVGDNSKNQLNADGFELIKEKYISWSVKYDIDKKDVIDTIIELYHNEKKFYDYLTLNKDFIIELFSSLGMNNFRTIQFFIETLRILFTYHIPDYSNIDRDIIYFTFVIASEYKLGNLSLFENVHQLPASVTGKDVKSSIILDMRTGQLTDQSKSTKTEFQKMVEEFESHFQKYISWNRFVSNSEYDVKYAFIEPIYTLITTGYLNHILLNDLLSTLIKIKKKPITIKRNELITKLSNYFDLTEKEIDDTYQELLSDIKGGSLDLSEFTQAINLLLWLCNRKLILFSQKEIEELFSENIEKINFNIENYNENEINFGLDYYFRDLEDSKNEFIYKKLKEKFTDFENKYKNAKILQKLKSDPDFLIDEVNFSDAINELEGSQIAEIIVHRILDRQFLRKVGSNVVKKYGTSNSGDFYFNHEIKLQEIFDLVNSAKGDPKLDRMDKYFVDDFLSKLQNRINHLNKTRKYE